MSQSVTFSVPPSDPGNMLQAVSEAAAARAVHTARKRIFTKVTFWVSNKMA
ncbi:hypothetical protein [Streptomyces sp. NPDC051211]|uniref:hypothetical protein n=1 Tax=Streptomyces sp. NPDC051211 TaxID=3154643 RepID=UPI0034505098